jgi:mannose-1-phosphate guanylyltransferase/mannose-6-phosphate isomerase
LQGDVLAIDCKNSYIASTSRLVTAIGLEGVVVVETADAILVMPRERSQGVKQIVDALKGADRVETRSTASRTVAAERDR